ncbi:hypothetical protein P9112_005352 [Eukaryota sp. TZLM1-RC]
MTITIQGSLGLTTPHDGPPRSVELVHCAVSSSFFNYGCSRVSTSFLSFHSQGNFLLIKDLSTNEQLRFHVAENIESWVSALSESSKCGSPLLKRVLSPPPRRVPPLLIPIPGETCPNSLVFNRFPLELRSPPIDAFEFIEQ